MIKAQELYIAAIKQTQLSLYELTKQQQQSADDEAAKAAKLKNYNENLKAQQAAAYSGKDADAIAGAHLFSSADALAKVYEELSAKVRAHKNLTDEELETLKELEKPYQAIQKLRADELAGYQKTLAEQKTLDDSMVATADALRAEDERRMMNGDAMRREYGESAAYNAAFDKLKSLADKLDNTDLTAGERESVLSKELAKMLADARAQSVHGTETTLDAKGIKGIKDFKYTDFSVDEKMLSVQEDIQRAAQDTNTLLETISTKLPAPIMAQ